MKLRDLQLEELNILKECLKIIERHELSYFMLGGTFLGAVRHKGFIPWDDDIDIGLPRDDYEQFILFAKNELSSPYKIRTFKTDDSYDKYNARVTNSKILLARDDAMNERTVELWIDIFPLDGMPDNVIARGIHKFRLLVLRLLFQYANFEKGVNVKKRRNPLEFVLIRAGFVIFKVCRFDIKKRLDAIDCCLKKFRYQESKFVVNFMGAYKFREMFPHAYYDNPVKYNFEDLKLDAPAEYDKVLSQMYGDYMKPPAQSQRFSHSITLKNYEK